MNIPKVISQMSLGDKIAFCTGADFWQTKQMEQYGIPPMMMADGPHGLRKQAGEGDHLGIGDSVVAVCFPAACATASKRASTERASTKTASSASQQRSSQHGCAC